MSEKYPNVQYIFISKCKKFEFITEKKSDSSCGIFETSEV